MALTWKKLIAEAASAASQASREPGGPLLTAESTTAEIEAWLHWNDPNGCHLPAQAEAEGFEPYADDDAWEALGQMILDSATTAWRAEYMKAVEDAMIAERTDSDRVAANRAPTSPEPCPTCGAAPGSPCVYTGTTHPRFMLHRARVGAGKAV